MSKKTKQLVKVLNDLFNDKVFLSKLCLFCNNDYESVINALGKILSYYISSLNNNKLSVEELNVVYDIFNNNPDTINEIYSSKENIIDNGYLTKTINSYFLNDIKKGFTSNKYVKVDEMFEYLETIFGKNEYSNSSMLSLNTPGSLSFHYSGLSSPRRLFEGILKEKTNNIQFIVGENKSNYYKRILKNKLLNTSINKKEKKNVLKIGNNLINTFCKQKTVLLLIECNNCPIEILNNKSKSITYNNYATSLTKKNLYDFFSNDIDNDKYNVELSNTSIPCKNIGIVSIPDKYDIISLIAINKGYKKKDKYTV